MAELTERAIRRNRALKKGVLGVDGQYVSVPCIVKDMHEEGARIEISDAIPLPKNFMLHVEIDGFQVECELVWHRPPMAGLKFLGPKEETLLGRKQTLKTSNEALSQSVLSDIEARKRPCTISFDKSKMFLNPPKKCNSSLISRESVFGPKS